MMDTATAARAVGGRLIGANVTFRAVNTDSRAVTAGDLFVALAGERFDGHAFVPAAFAQGAAAAVVGVAQAPGLAGDLIAVPDPQKALGQLAAYWRARLALPLALVVGSNGKTTVKEMTAAILRAQFGADAVHATSGNLNNAIGLPLTLLRMTPAHRVAVVELGMNHRGETRELAAIAAPTIVVVNNAQREHQEFMASVAEVADEHADALRALRSDGVAVLNADDPYLPLWQAAAAERGARVVTFGLADAADVTAASKVRADGSDVALRAPEGEVRFTLPVPGRHMVGNALAAAATARALGASLPAIGRGLAAFRPVVGRLVAQRLPNGALVIDDTYNANPDSVRAAIDVLAAAAGVTWLVLGDMGEVGAEGPAFHREVGAYAKERGITRLLATGELAREAVGAFGAGGTHYAEIDALADAARQDAHAGVTLLVKGSRFMRMERVVAALAGTPCGAAH